jgi:hypothetical protein
VIAGEIPEQGHLGQRRPLGFGRVAHGLQVALVEMFQAGQQHARREAFQVLFDLDDRRNRLARLTEEFQTDGARVRGTAMQHPTCAGDDAVAAFLLHARQAAEELVGHVLAQPDFAELASRDREPLAPQLRGLVRRLTAIFPEQLELGALDVVNLSHVMGDAADFQPVALAVDHAPPGEIVDGRAPQDGLLAAGVHRDIAADAAGVGRGRIDGEHQAALGGGVRDAARHHAGFGENGCNGVRQPRQAGALDAGQALELLGVDDGRQRSQRQRAPGVAGSAAARNDGQTQLDARADQRRYLDFAVGNQYDERVFDAPVGRVGDVRDPGVGVEADVVGASVSPQGAQRAAPERFPFPEVALECLDRAARGFQQLSDPLEERPVVGIAAAVDGVQPMVQRLDELGAAAAGLEQVVLKVRIAPHDPDVAEHLVEHAGRTAGAPLGPQFLDDAPEVCPEQTDHDLAVGERRVVVWDLAQSSRLAGVRRLGGQRRTGRYSVHGHAQSCG